MIYKILKENKEIDKIILYVDNQNHVYYINNLVESVIDKSDIFISLRTNNEEFFKLHEGIELSKEELDKIKEFLLRDNLHLRYKNNFLNNEKKIIQKIIKKIDLR